jgi:hypothetical protein
VLVKLDAYVYYYYDNHHATDVSVCQALMSLFVLASKDGWVNIMYTGLDAVGIDQQVHVIGIQGVYACLYLCGLQKRF